jgi:hypothetical protein
MFDGFEIRRATVAELAVPVAELAAIELVIADRIAGISFLRNKISVNSGI